MSNSHHPHPSDHSSVHENPRPYWKGMHRDWRFWVAVVLMLAAMFVYVMSMDFAWLPRPHQQPPPSSDAGQ